jgi:hypothetical protein
VPALVSPAGREESAAALGKLSSMLVHQHRDYLFQDLLHRSSSAHFGEAARELAEAIRMDTAGNREEGYQRAQNAVTLFRGAGNSAGALRAEVEAVYALSRSYETSKCLELSGAVLQGMGGRYPWARVQTLLARSQCLANIGDFAGAQALLAKSIQLAGQHEFHQLQLRAMGLDAASRTLLGDVDAARRLDHDGLGRFWAGLFSPFRVYQFYSDLSHIAEHNRHWHAAYLTSKEAVPAIEMAGNIATEAMARYRLATFAGLTGRRVESLDEMHRADELLRQSHARQSAATLRAENVILMAKAYLQTDATDLAPRRTGDGS